MANPDSPLNGQGAALDLVADPITGDPRLKAAGRDMIVTGAGDLGAPQLVEDATLLAGHGAKAVSAGPTRAPLAASTTPCRRVSVKAHVANTGVIYLGLSTVTADTNASTGGLQLSPGEWFTFGADDLADIYIHGTAGEGVSFAYEL